jgi:dephospho-CoA kinase
MPAPERTVLRVGLTGGIASGKSTVAELFAARGVPVIDTDVLAREVVTAGEPALERIVARFGTQVLDARGGLDRRELRQRVFADDAARRDLEAILHPAIRAALEARSARLDGPYQVHIIPLLAEKGLGHTVDRVLVVDCPRTLQLERLMARDAMEREAAERMLAAQAAREERLAIADDVIVNAGDRAGLVPAVDALHRYYLALAAATCGR